MSVIGRGEERRWGACSPFLIRWNEEPGVGANIAERSPLQVANLQEMTLFLICTGSVAMIAVKHLSHSLNHDLPLASKLTSLILSVKHEKPLQPSRRYRTSTPISSRLSTKIRFFVICNLYQRFIPFATYFFFLSGPTIVSLSLYNCCAYYLSDCPFFYHSFLVPFIFWFCFVPPRKGNQTQGVKDHVVSFQILLQCNSQPSGLVWPVCPSGLESQPRAGNDKCSERMLAQRRDVVRGEHIQTRRQIRQAHTQIQTRRNKRKEAKSTRDAREKRDKK